MKLIILYGPPAVGKLTVAKALSERCGYRIFHNHLSRDLVRSLFPSDHPRFPLVVERIRLDLIEEAANAGIDGVIFTLVYESGEDDNFLEKIKVICDKYGSEVYFVQLKTDPDTLQKRVTDESRQAYAKITSAEKLRDILSQHQLLDQVPFDNNVSIDTTKTVPSDAAQQILSFINSGLSNQKSRR